MRVPLIPTVALLVALVASPWMAAAQEADSEGGPTTVDQMIQSAIDIKDRMDESFTRFQEAATRSVNSAEEAEAQIAALEEDLAAIIEDFGETSDFGAQIQALIDENTELKQLAEEYAANADTPERRERWEGEVTAADERIARINELSRQVDRDVGRIAAARDDVLADLDFFVFQVRANRAEAAVEELSTVADRLSEMADTVDNIVAEAETLREPEAAAPVGN